MAEGGVFLILFALILASNLYVREYHEGSQFYRYVYLVILSSSFISLGFVCSMINIWKKQLVLIISFFALCVVAAFNLLWDLQLGMLNLTAWNLPTLIFVYVMAFVGIIWVWSFSAYIDNSKLGNIFDYLGQNTMPILVWHFLSFKIVSFLIVLIYGIPIDKLSGFPTVKTNNSWQWIAYFFVGLVVPLFISKAIRMMNQKIGMITFTKQ